MSKVNNGVSVLLPVPVSSLVLFCAFPLKYKWFCWSQTRSGNVSGCGTEQQLKTQTKSLQIQSSMFILQTSSWAVTFLSHRTAMQSIIFMKLNGFINKYNII